MRRSTKKWCILILCMLFVLSIIAACGKADSTNSPKTDQKDQDAKTADTTNQADITEDDYQFKLPLMDEVTEVVWATCENWYPPASYNDGLEVWETIGDRTNIRIKWEVLPDEQYNTSMQTRLAAAQGLPDILRVPGGDPTQYGQQGLLIPMNDLIDKYGVNIKYYFDYYPITGKIMRSGDGNYYGIAPIIIESSRWMANYFVVRKDWLDDLGIDPPETIDDWVVMLKAFRDQDANGDGDPTNEIPWGSPPEFFGEAFGLHLWASAWQGGFFTDDNGKVYYQYTDPRYKDFLTFANMMYQEKLLDPDYANPSAESLQAKATKNLVGSMNQWPDFAIGWSKLLRTSVDEDAAYMPVPPPVGPNGDQSMEGYGSVDMGFAGISKDCKNPEAAIKIMDYMWSEEGRLFLAYGIEGKTYNMVDGKPVYTDEVLNNEEGLGASDVLRTYGAWPTIPWVQQEYSYIQQLEAEPLWKNAAQTCLQPFYVEPFPALLATKEEQERLSVLLTDIRTYQSEMAIKFITGERSLDEFDDYVAELEAMGVADLLKIKQDQWDRTFE